MWSPLAKLSHSLASCVFFAYPPRPSPYTWAALTAYVFGYLPMVATMTAFFIEAGFAPVILRFTPHPFRGSRGAARRGKRRNGITRSARPSNRMRPLFTQDRDGLTLPLLPFDRWRYRRFTRCHLPFPSLAGGYRVGLHTELIC
jgi:hypothetical protein